MLYSWSSKLLFTCSRTEGRDGVLSSYKATTLPGKITVSSFSKPRSFSSILTYVHDTKMFDHNMVYSGTTTPTGNFYLSVSFSRIPFYSLRL